MKCEICSSGCAEQNLRLCRACIETIVRLWKLTAGEGRPASDGPARPLQRECGNHLQIPASQRR